MVRSYSVAHCTHSNQQQFSNKVEISTNGWMTVDHDRIVLSLVLQSELCEYDAGDAEGGSERTTARSKQFDEEARESVSELVRASNELQDESWPLTDVNLVGSLRREKQRGQGGIPCFKRRAEQPDRAVVEPAERDENAHRGRAVERKRPSFRRRQKCWLFRESQLEQRSRRRAPERAASWRSSKASRARRSGKDWEKSEERRGLARRASGDYRWAGRCSEAC